MVLSRSDSKERHDTGNNVYGCVKELFLLKKKNRNLKVLLSIGGWTYSSNLRLAFETEGGRQKFADSSVELLKNLGFDGIDVDFEYPVNCNEVNQFVDTLPRLPRLTQAAIISYSPLHPLLRQHLAQMAYDYAGSWDTVVSHDADLHASNSNLASTPFNTDQAIDYYTSQGVAYQRSWPALQRCWLTNLDQEAASYCYNSGSHLFINYDTSEIARKKGEYTKSKGLGGGMWWKLSGDKQGDDSLTIIVVNTVGGTGALDKSENQLSYPASKYDNLKAGF
ncbi:hypothetical protein BBP40_004327 [Aspergillus hancockii]|nr:hypothetical protein BBP40_004327 [Aspergillus hancockii]